MVKNWPDYARLDQQPMLAQYLLFPVQIILRHRRERLT